MKNYTSRITLDKRYSASGKYAVRLCVTIDRKRSYFPIKGYNMSKANWKSMHGTRPGERKETLLKLQAKEKQAKAILDKMPDWNIEQFRSRFFNSASPELLKSHFQDYISQLDEHHQVKTSMMYNSVKNNLEKFKAGLTLDQVTQETLKQFESWLLEKRSITAVSINMRCLRTVINKAIAAGDFDKDAYPFGRYKYQIPAPRSKRKMLSQDEIEKLFEYDSKDERMVFARDMFLFLYLTGGRNAIDLCHLTFDAIHNGYIEFTHRQKLSRNAADQRPLKVKITDDIQNILNKWKQKKEKIYVFDILNPKMDHKEMSDAIGLFIHRVNEALKEIGKELKFEVTLTTGLARSTMANILLRSGETVALISDIMGHNSIKTTQLYLKGFETKAVNEALGKLRKRETA